MMSADAPRPARALNPPTRLALPVASLHPDQSNLPSLSTSSLSPGISPATSSHPTTPDGVWDMPDTCRNRDQDRRKPQPGFSAHNLSDINW